MIPKQIKAGLVESGELSIDPVFSVLRGLMIYGTDKIKIVNVSTDKYGVKTRTVNDEIDARIKDTNRLIINNRGEQVVGFAVIMIEKGNTVNYGDEILITKRWGKDYKLKDKYFKIQKIEDIGGFSSSYIRVTL
jgi:hypothetical protein